MMYSNEYAMNDSNTEKAIQVANDKDNLMQVNRHLLLSEERIM